MTLVEVLPYAVLGAVLGLDVVSFPQAMLSRPIVAATIAGAFAGSALYGLLLGAIVELFALEMLAVGASRYPEWGSASVVGGALFAADVERQATAPALAMAVAATLLVAWIGGWSMYGLRKLNGRLARRSVPRLEQGDYATVMRLQLVGLTSDLVRGGVLAAAGILLLAPASARIVSGAGVPDGVWLTVTWGLALAAGVSACWRIFRGSSGASWWLAAGLIVGLLLVVMR